MTLKGQRLWNLNISFFELKLVAYLINSDIANCITGAALTACSMLKALAKIADDDEELELSQDLLDHAKYVQALT